MGVDQRQPAQRDERSIVRASGLLVGLLVIAISLGGAPRGAVAQQASTAIVTGTDRVFVRRGPGNEFPPFASIPSGSTVDVQEMRGEWARIITASGQVGYINSRFLSLPGETERPHVPTPRPTPARPTPRPTPSRALSTPTPALPTYTHPPTRTLPPSATRTETRTRIPTRTPTQTKTPSATRTTKSSRTPTIAATPSATSSPSLTPTSREPLSARTAIQHSRDLESEIAALKQELAEAKAQHRAPDEAAAAPIADGCSDQVRTELARLAVAVESMQHRLSGIPGPSPEVVLPTPPSNPAPADNHLFPPVAIALGGVGVFIGWVLGRSHALRQERSRRLRLRF